VSYDLEKVKIGRKQLTMCGLIMDYCALEYGKSYQNLLTYSEEFDHANWTKTNSPDITADTDFSPDTELTAYTVGDSNASLFSLIDQGLSSYTSSNWYTVSVFIKRDFTGRTSRFPLLRIQFSGSVTDEADINVDTNTGEYNISGTASNKRGGVEIHGDYWRVWITAKTDDAGNTASSCLLYPAVGGSPTWVYDATASGSIIAWGAQAVVGNKPGHYVKATVTATLSCDAADAKANLLLRSEEFDNASWTKSGATITANNAGSPDGVQEADSFIEDSSTGAHFLQQSITTVSGNQYTASAYVKANGRTQVRIRLGDSNSYGDFDLSNTVLLAGGSSLISHSIEILNDDWFRLSVSVLADGASEQMFIQLLSGGSDSYTGDGSSGLYVFGAQAVLGENIGRYYTTTSAAHSGTVGEECTNTRVSCEDVPNYTKHLKEYIFSQPRSNLPPGLNIFPHIQSEIAKSSTSITSGKGLGKRAIARVKIADFPHHDRGIDKYAKHRPYAPNEQGTFWGKFIARNPYYEGRTCRIYYGYLGDSFNWDDFETQEYDITDIYGPDKGTIDIVAKDILVRTYDRKAKYPAASTGKLSADILIDATSATLIPSGIGNDEYPASGYVSMGKEMLGFTRSGDVLTLTHNEWGTEAKAHKLNDLVQVCASWDGTTLVTDVLNELLITGASLPASYIPTAEWDIEAGLWLQNAYVKGILMKPESIEKVIAELAESFMFDMWWSAVSQTIKLKALAPEASTDTVNTFTEGSNIIQGSLKIKRKSAERFTEVRVYFDKLDYSDKNEPENFQQGQIAADIGRSGSDQYGSNTIKEIFSRWFNNAGNALQLSGRTLARFSDTPEYITFELDQKDHGQVELAERSIIDSYQFQGLKGANSLKTFQITEINEGRGPGHKFKVKALTSMFEGRYFFIAPNSTPDYSSASQAQKDNYGFICQNTGDFADGTEGHKII